MFIVWAYAKGHEIPNTHREKIVKDCIRQSLLNFTFDSSSFDNSLPPQQLQ